MRRVFGQVDCWEHGAKHIAQMGPSCALNTSEDARHNDCVSVYCKYRLRDALPRYVISAYCKQLRARHSWVKASQMLCGETTCRAIVETYRSRVLC